MSYSLGVDVGTTFTSAAVWVDGRVEVVSLESHRVAVPSVVFASGDDLMFGSPASERAATEPAGVAREFKRQLGDRVPLILSGAPYSADQLVARFAAWVVATVSDQRGEPPGRVVITHPANWTEFQIHLLKNGLDQVGLGDAGFLTEPQAAAVDFGGAAHLEPGDLVVVYDLGGGTFDVAMLRRTEVGFEHVGEPGGVERLGGIDFDEAVFHRVTDAVPDEVLAAARSDLTGRMALVQLRRRCVEAKERLSEDVAADIPVVLPGSTSTIRVIRAEFEEMIRPMLRQTIVSVRRVVETSGVSPSDLSAALLVGGSSRIPAVSDLVRVELGVPVRIDAHPKLVVARGAARWAGALAAEAGVAEPIATGAQVPRNRGAYIAAGVVALAAAVGGVLWWAIGRDDDPDVATDIIEAGADTADRPATADAVPAATATPAGATTTVATTVPTAATSSTAATEAPRALPLGPFEGSWEGIDLDGSTMRVTFSGSGGERRVVLTGDDATFSCNTGGLITGRGTGIVDGDRLAVEELALDCADGTPVGPISMVFTYDESTNTLSDNTCNGSGCVVYHRVEVSAASTTAPATTAPAPVGLTATFAPVREGVFVVERGWRVTPSQQEFVGIVRLSSPDGGVATGNHLELPPPGAVSDPISLTWSPEPARRVNTTAVYNVEIAGAEVFEIEFRAPMSVEGSLDETDVLAWFDEWQPQAEAIRSPLGESDPVLAPVIETVDS